MIILEKSSCIIFYSVNPKYFDKFSTVSCENSSSNYWQTAESNSYTFKYNIHFRAKDEQSGELFIENKSQMTCTVKIENEKEDARQMLILIKEFHESMNLFIKNNSLSYFSKLNLEEYEATEMGLIKMEAGIARVKDQKPHEDKTELEKKLEKEFEDIKLEVRIIKVKTSID